MNSLLVTGLSKSGTTLLMSLLDGHKNIFMYPEEPFFRDVFKGRYKNKEEMIQDFKRRNPIFYNGKMRYDVEDWKKIVDDYISDFDDRREHVNSLWYLLDYSFYSFLIDGSLYTDETEDKLRYLAFKDTNFFSLDKFFSLDYNNKAIIIQRDLRGNYNSTKRTNDKKGIMHLLNYISFWKWADMYYTKAYLEFGSDRILIINYEDLVLHNENTITNICNFLEIENHVILKTPTCLGEKIKVSTATSNAKGVYKDSLFKWGKNLLIIEKIILKFFLKIPKLMEVMAIGRATIKAAKNIGS